MDVVDAIFELGEIIMKDHEVRGGRVERVVTRLDPKTSLLRSYVLTLPDYERLVAEGFDPETIAEAERSRRATHSFEFDALGREAMKLSRTLNVSVTVYALDGDPFNADNRPVQGNA